MSVKSESIADQLGKPPIKVYPVHNDEQLREIMVKEKSARIKHANIIYHHTGPLGITSNQGRNKTC